MWRLTIINASLIFRREIRWSLTRRFLRISFSLKYRMSPSEFGSVSRWLRVLPRKQFRPTGTSKGAEISRWFPSNCHSRLARSLLNALFRDIAYRALCFNWVSQAFYHVSHKWKSCVLRWPFFTTGYRGWESFRITSLIKIFPWREIRVIVDFSPPDHVRSKSTPFASIAHSIRGWRCPELNLRLRNSFREFSQYRLHLVHRSTAHHVSRYFCRPTPLEF